jgi:hypothetical protein
MKREGKGYAEIAEAFGITKARVSQIVAREYEDVSDDSYRESMRLDIEGKLAELNRLIASPGKPMVSPGGKIICHYSGDYDDEGKPVIDYSKPVYDEFVKVDAIKAYLTALERLSRLHALDRPKAKERDESKEFSEAMEYVGRLADENKQLRLQLETAGEPSDVVDAEVIEAGDPAP